MNIFPMQFYMVHYSWGGMAIPSVQSKTTTTRINYFLYHTRMGTKVGQKLDTSMAFLQLEAGTFQQFLTLPYELYGNLITRTLIKRLWAETEPHGITLRSSPGLSWTPSPQGESDFSLTEFINGKYLYSG